VASERSVGLLRHLFGDLEQRTRLRIEGIREPPDHLDRRVPRPALDVAYVGPMHSGLVAQGFLESGFFAHYAPSTIRSGSEMVLWAGAFPSIQTA
jgi:hypothetical protein